MPYPRSARCRVMPRAAATVAFIASCLAAAAAAAQGQPWPTRPVTLVVGVPPGSTPDSYARAVGERLGRVIGQQVIVETRAGANGNVAAEYVLRAPADGHTLWVAAQSMAEINPSAYDELRWKPSDFVGVIKGADAPLLLAAHPSMRVRTMAELDAWVKANPEKAAYASFGGGTTSQFAGYVLAERMGRAMTHVPFNGSAPQIQNLVGGHVLFGFTQIQTGLPHVREGRLVALATSGATRWRQLPDVPTLVELGYKDLVATTWFGLMVRSATPPAVVARIVDAAKRAHDDPDLRTKLDAMGLDVSGESGAAFDESVRAGLARWGAIVKATGFRATQ